MSIALRRDGETTFAGAGPDAVFEIGGVSEVFTGTVLALLAGEGVLSLADPVPSLPGVTLAHLATHTSGLPSLPDDFKAHVREHPSTPYPDEKLEAFVRRAPRKHPPGTKTSASISGAALLGHLLATRTGRSLEMLHYDRVSVPLGMRDTSSLVGAEQVARLIAGHAPNGEAWPAHLGPSFKSHALRSTVADLARFVAANLDPASPLAPAFACAREPHHRGPKGRGRGLGWILTAHDGGPAAMVLGFSGGHSTYVAFHPERRAGVVVHLDHVRSLWSLVLRRSIAHAGRDLLARACASG